MRSDALSGELCGGREKKRGETTYRVQNTRRHSLSLRNTSFGTRKDPFSFSICFRVCVCFKVMMFGKAFRFCCTISSSFVARSLCGLYENGKRKEGSAQHCRADVDRGPRQRTTPHPIRLYEVIWFAVCFGLVCALICSLAVRALEGRSYCPLFLPCSSFCIYGYICTLWA